MKVSRSLGLALVSALVLTVATAGGEFRSDGDSIARDFTVFDRRNGEPVRLSDFAGHIVVLDFFAHWCEPCRSASADVERNIRRHYADPAGNPAGLPVTVIGVNIDTRNPQRTAGFVRAVGFALAVDDTRHEAFRQFGEKNAIPLVVIINGTAGESGSPRWEVLYRRTGYAGAAALRRIIDAVGRSHPPGQSAPRGASPATAARGAAPPSLLSP